MAWERDVVHKDKKSGIAAIVVSFDSGEVLSTCLQALKDQGIAAIVVDNASEDDSVAVATSFGTRVIANPRNEGFGRAMNIGVRAAGGYDHVLLINPDAQLMPGAAEAMLSAAITHGAGIVGPRIIAADGGLFFPVRSFLSPYLQNPRGIRHEPEGDCCVPFLSGACYLISRALFLETGGFDEEIFLFYEDNDLCRRVIDAGHSIVYAHDAVIRHAPGHSSRPQRGRRHTARWHYAWSEGYVARKYGLPDPSIRTLLRNAFKYLGAALIFDRRGRERYGGAAAGAFASLKRKSALARQGLADGKG
jgi:N-acetylglucosaminyl-diphospho-decaprenol L-rhamnosyltransferase